MNEEAHILTFRVETGNNGVSHAVLEFHPTWSVPTQAIRMMMDSVGRFNTASILPADAAAAVRSAWYCYGTSVWSLPSQPLSKVVNITFTCDGIEDQVHSGTMHLERNDDEVALCFEWFAHGYEPPRGQALTYISIQGPVAIPIPSHSVVWGLA